MTRETKDWSATKRDLNFGGGGNKVSVEGSVQFLSSNEKFSLEEIDPTGINPSSLILKLVVTKGSIGTDPVDWTKVNYTHDFPGRQINEVSVIVDNGKPIPVPLTQTIHS